MIRGRLIAMSESGWWNKTPLNKMTDEQWEALCDRCGKCCLNKLVNDEGDYFYTSVSCSLMNSNTSCCTQYKQRLQLKSGCLKVTPKNINDIVEWLPKTCAYRLLHQGQPLHAWHPLLNDGQVTHAVHIQFKNRLVSEDHLKTAVLEDFIVEDEGLL